MLIIQKKQYPLLAGTFIGSVCFGLSQNVIRKEMIMAIPASWMSLENVLFFISLMGGSYFWNRIQSWMLRNYVRIEIAETILISGMYIYFMLHWNARAYYMVDLLYYVLVGSLIGRAASAIKIRLFPGVQEKIDADNNFEFFASVSGILGYGAAIFVELPVFWCLMLFLIGDLFRTGAFLYTVCSQKTLLDAKT